MGTERLPRCPNSRGQVKYGNGEAASMPKLERSSEEWEQRGCFDAQTREVKGGMGIERLLQCPNSRGQVKNGNREAVSMPKLERSSEVRERRGYFDAQTREVKRSMGTERLLRCLNSRGQGKYGS